MESYDSIGLAKAWAQHLAIEAAKHPNALLKEMFDRGAGVEELLSEMNKLFAVVKYGDGICVANIIGKQLDFMSEQEFHKMLANGEETESPLVQVALSSPIHRSGSCVRARSSTRNTRRYDQHVSRLRDRAGCRDWSLMRAHILNVLCAERQDLADYLIQWMAWSVQKLEPIGVAVALLGEQGAGKGIFARTFGSFFGNHFAHIANGDQLTGRFNASVAKSCFVFLDEAVWAGDKKGEGVLKALITEPTLTLEAKFRDPITVKNCLRIVVASNNEWAVPTGIGDRRWLILNINNRYAGTKNATYFAALKHEIDSGGSAAMLHDLLAMDLSHFNVRDVPRTAAKAQQQALSLPSVEAWLYQTLQEGAVEQRGQPGNSLVRHDWQTTGLIVSKDIAYAAYEDFSSRRKEYRPATKSVWSKRLINLLGPTLMPIRHAADGGRIRSFRFADLTVCRDQFAAKIGADFEWEPCQPTQSASAAPPAAVSQVNAGAPTGQGRPQVTPVTAAEAVSMARSISVVEDFIAKRR